MEPIEVCYWAAQVLKAVRRGDLSPNQRIGLVDAAVAAGAPEHIISAARGVQVNVSRLRAEEIMAQARAACPGYSHSAHRDSGIDKAVRSLAYLTSDAANDHAAAVIRVVDPVNASGQWMTQVWSRGGGDEDPFLEPLDWIWKIRFRGLYLWPNEENTTQVMACLKPDDFQTGDLPWDPEFPLPMSSEFHDDPNDAVRECLTTAFDEIRQFRNRLDAVIDAHEQLLKIPTV